MTADRRMPRRRRLIAAIGLSLAALAGLLGAGRASALTFVPHVEAGSFEAFPTGANEPSVADVAVDQASGSVYVVANLSGQLKLFKFDAQGMPSSFGDPGLGGADQITVFSGEVGVPRVAVDNSGGPYQGRIYVTNKAAASSSKTFAFGPSGAPVGGKFPIEVAGTQIAVDPTTGNFWQNAVNLVGHIIKFLPDGTETANDLTITQEEEPGENQALDLGAEGNIYTLTYPNVLKLDQTGKIIGRTRVGSYGAIATNQVNGNVIYVGTAGGRELDSKGDELPGFAFEGNQERTTLALNGANDYLYVAKGTDPSVTIFKPGAPVTLPDVEIEPPSDIAATSLRLHATVNPDGVATTRCYFEYGPTLAYGKTAPCSPGEQLTGSAPIAVSADLTGLRKGGLFHYRLFVENANVPPNNTLRTEDRTARSSSVPVLGAPYVDQVHADGGLFHDEITPEGAPTTFHIVYGTADCVLEPGSCSTTTESASVGSGLAPVLASFNLTGLAAATTYHYLFVATNQSGSVASAEQTFTTFPLSPGSEDSCPNAHVRQQTGAARLPDCRAYELVSAANQNGYDIESLLTPGQEPFGGYPGATNPPKVLYGVHNGALPGTGNPTNRGLDPYVATRGEAGWTTRYVGVPANIPYSTESFGSPLAGADASLDTFAFGGPGLCSPCFADGTTGEPVTLPDGSLVQGMTGPLAPGPAARSELLIEKALSADGGHLVFGSSAEFEAGAGSPAIYDRDLRTGVTHAVSKLPSGAPIPCVVAGACDTDGLAELDISADGSHIVLGQLVDTDSVGNRYWHLYENVGDSPRSIDLTPGAADGVLFDGMTEDGAHVYFTTVDRLAGADTDGSADVYRADVGSGAALTLVSVGGGNGDTDDCSPVGNSVDVHWNSADGEEDCGVVAVGGGGGVASRDGSIYFLSPELLAGTSESQDGVADAPNLYVARPGSAPRFVVTLDSSLNGPNPPLRDHRPTFTFATTKNPTFVAVDNSGGPSDGDIYVSDGTDNVVRKYDPTGKPVTGWAEDGVLSGPGATPFAPISGIAVGTDGTLYVAVSSQFNGEKNLDKFSEDGTLIEEGGIENEPQPIGIAVDGLGRVYYEGYSGRILRFTPGIGTSVISTWIYKSGVKTGLAVDPSGDELYVDFGGESIARFEFDDEGRVIEASGNPCTDECDPSEVFGAEEVSNGKSLALEPGTGDLYVDLGDRVLRFLPNHRLAPGPGTGDGLLSNSYGIAADTAGNFYATNAGPGGANVQAFGPLVLAPDPRTDNPIVTHGVNEAGIRHSADFQVTPGGNYALLPTAIPYPGFDANEYDEVFRYEAASGAVLCVSCNSTGSKATGEGALAANGLSLLEDGRVFFDSTEPLVPRDLDNREDVYEWEDGTVNLISTGISSYASSLLTASADGTDVYFFTRDSLTPQDNNGKLVKIYDARAGGGFPYAPEPVTCKASDECHGPSTEPGPSPGINTITGTGGNLPKPKVCTKKQVKKHGKCKKKKRKGKRHHRRHARSKAAKKRKHR